MLHSNVNQNNTKLNNQTQQAQQVQQTNNSKAIDLFFGGMIGLMAIGFAYKFSVGFPQKEQNQTQEFKQPISNSYIPKRHTVPQLSKSFIEEDGDEIDYLTKKSNTNLTEAELEAKYDIPTGLLSAIHLVETSGRCHVDSHAGAKGCFQFTDQTIKEIKRLFKYSFDPYNYDESKIAAAMYLGYLSKRIEKLPIRKQDKLLWLAAAYNAGFNNVKKWVYDGRISFKETYKYAYKVKHNLKKINLVTRY